MNFNIPKHLIVIFFSFSDSQSKLQDFLTFTNNQIDVAIAFTISPWSNHFLHLSSHRFYPSPCYLLPQICQRYYRSLLLVILLSVLYVVVPDFYKTFSTTLFPLFRTMSSFLKWLYQIKTLIPFELAFNLRIYIYI